MADYDHDNIFAKILRREIPAEILYEDDYAMAFPDIQPAAKAHALVIPKGEYCSFDDFSKRAEAVFIAGFFKAVQQVAAKLGLEEGGYRLITNHGKNAHQTVPHFHVHVLGGQPLGGLLSGDTLER